MQQQQHQQQTGHVVLETVGNPVHEVFEEALSDLHSKSFIEDLIWRNRYDSATERMEKYAGEISEEMMAGAVRGDFEKVVGNSRENVKNMGHKRHRAKAKCKGEKTDGALGHVAENGGDGAAGAGKQGHGKGRATGKGRDNAAGQGSDNSAGKGRAHAANRAGKSSSKTVDKDDVGKEVVYNNSGDADDSNTEDNSKDVDIDAKDVPALYPHPGLATKHKQLFCVNKVWCWIKTLFAKIVARIFYSY